MTAATKWQETFAVRMDKATGSVTLNPREQAEILAALDGIQHQPIEQKRRLTIEQIKAVVSHYSHVTVQEMISASREAPIVAARSISMYLCRSYTPLGLSFIGRMHGRDHATVLHAIKNVRHWLETDPVVRTMVSDIRKNIEQINQ
jgi:chromosomal replication initiation ATPase DnaA